MILIHRSSPYPSNNYSDQPKSTRDKVVSELLETERKYVHDLEKLQVIQQGSVCVSEFVEGDYSGMASSSSSPRRGGLISKNR